MTLKNPSSQPHGLPAVMPPAVASPLSACAKPPVRGPLPPSEVPTLPELPASDDPTPIPPAPTSSPETPSPSPAPALFRGPTFPAVTATPKTPVWHRLAHDTTIPDASPLPARLHPLLLPGESGGASHNPTVFAWGADWARPELGVIVRVLYGTHTVNVLARVGRDWTLKNPQRLEPVAPLAPPTSPPPASAFAGPSPAPPPPSPEIEDLRVFFWQGRPWAVAATHVGSKEIRQTLLELDLQRGAILASHVQPSLRHEKNWMPCVDGEDLRLIYSVDPLIVLHTSGHGSRVLASPTATLIRQATGHVRGGSQLMAWGDGWLAVVHHVYRVPVVPPKHNHLLSSFWPPVVKDPVAGSAKVVYLHRFAQFDRDLETVTLGKPWVFQGFGIEFCAGLARFGDKIVASFGVADKEAWLAEIEEDEVLRTFETDVILP